MHCGTARFALACGLHQLVPPAFRSAETALTASSGVSLLAPTDDAIELAERIFTWWQIYIRDKHSTTVAGFVSCLPTDDAHPLERIETGFPRGMDDYEVRFQIRASFLY